MSRYDVFFSQPAQQQIEALEHYIAGAASPAVASSYIDALVEHCNSLSHFPNRGTIREDIRPGLRITHFRKRIAIAFNVKGSRVNILGIFYGGQDYERLLEEEN